MTTGAILILITQVVTLVTAALSFWASRKNKAALHRVEINIDGRLSELLELTKKSSHAEGVKSEKDHPT